MPIFLASLLGGLVMSASTIVGRVLIALAIGYVTYQGVDLLLDNISELLFSSFDGLDGQVMAVLGLLKVGECINIQISAVGARLVLAGLTSGAVSRMVIK